MKSIKAQQNTVKWTTIILQVYNNFGISILTLDSESKVSITRNILRINKVFLICDKNLLLTDDVELSKYVMEYKISSKQQWHKLCI